MFDSKKFFLISSQIYLNNTASILANPFSRLKFTTILPGLFLTCALFPHPCVLAQDETKLSLNEAEMEPRSIQHADKGQLQRALAILEGNQYSEQKEIYTKVVTRC